MDANKTRVVRTVSGTKLHIASVYEDGGLGRWAVCGADTKGSRMMAVDAEPTCKNCIKNA